MKIVENITKANAVTHAGVFHADEVFATVVLDNVFKEGLSLARTFRIPDDISDDVIVYDLGFGKYDHHQKDAARRSPEHKYAAFGLIWRDYGTMYLASLGIPLATARELYDIVDKKFVSMIDALDNGETPENYYPFNPAPFISMYNPNWDETDKNETIAFLAAVRYADVFLHMIISSEWSKLKAKTIVDKAIEKTDNRILFLSCFVPWQEHLFNNEAGKDILFTIFPNKRGGWAAQCVPTEPGSFEQKCPVPVEWRANPSATGIEGCNFVHASGFIAGFDTVEGAYSYCRRAIAEFERRKDEEEA